ncbi:MAG: 4-hydroxy-tetrahydrodipicolinate synthase [Candidatus Omnitrophota bacterium]
MYQGSFVALVTPFKEDGSVDEQKFKELIDFQIKNGTDGIVPCGCTGEAATLTHEEQKKTIKIAVEIVNGRVPVIAGTGSNSTEEAVALTCYAKKAGADGALIITPYYNKPTPEGQYRHYERIAKKSDLPIMLYNVPSRTGISMLPETVARLSKVDNIVAIKEASGIADQTTKILSLCDICVLSGDDSMTLPLMSIGAKGVVSVVANITPNEVSGMVKAYLNKDFEKAKELHYKLFPLIKAVFIETNPIPVKTAMRILGRLNGKLRLPLCEMEAQNEKTLEEVLKKYDFE